MRPSLAWLYNSHLKLWHFHGRFDVYVGVRLPTLGVFSGALLDSVGVH